MTGSPYAYAGDNPVIATDPSGLYWLYSHTWTLTHAAALRWVEYLDEVAEGGASGGEAGAPAPGVGEFLAAAGGVIYVYAKGLAIDIATKNDLSGSKGVIVTLGLGAPHDYLPPYPRWEVVPRLRPQPHPRLTSLLICPPTASTT